MHGLGKPLHDPGELGLGITVESETGAFRSGLLRACAPFGETLRRGAVEEEGQPEQFFDGPLDVGAQGIDNSAKAFRLARLFLDLLQIVADGLFAGNRGDRAEYHGKETGRALLSVP